MTTLTTSKDGPLQCGNEACGTLLVQCRNYSVHHVCNRCCIHGTTDGKDAELCDYCRFNDTIPDLSVPGNREMWLRLENAKRRLLYTLDLLQLPYGTVGEGAKPALAFDFKTDKPIQDKRWRSLRKQERVYTGHADGKITINLREADPVEREKNRVLFQEAHRTVVGHFRHEIAHFYWQMLVQDVCENDCKTVFGDHEEPTYSEAQRRYYEDGPKEGWQAEYVSAYATMHPWEDFAETFATYLDMVSVLDTAWNVGINGGCDPTRSDLPDMVDAYIRLGVVLNETNRAMGLIDLVPEILTPMVVRKLQYVHDLVRSAPIIP